MVGLWYHQHAADIPRGLEGLKGRVRVNELKLNPDKMEVSLVGSNLLLGNDCMLILVGVTLTPKSSGANRAFYQRRQVCQLLPFLEKSATMAASALLV